MYYTAKPELLLHLPVIVFSATETISYFHSILSKHIQCFTNLSFTLKRDALYFVSKLDILYVISLNLID